MRVYNVYYTCIFTIFLQDIFRSVGNWACCAVQTSQQLKSSTFPLYVIPRKRSGELLSYYNCNVCILLLKCDRSTIIYASIDAWQNKFARPPLMVNLRLELPKLKLSSFPKKWDRKTSEVKIVLQWEKGKDRKIIDLLKIIKKDNSLPTGLYMAFVRVVSDAVYVN